MADEEKQEKDSVDEPEEDETVAEEPADTDNVDKSTEEIAAEEAMLEAMSEEQLLADSSLEDLHKSLEQSAEQETLGMMEQSAAAGQAAPEVNGSNLDLLIDVSLQVSVELGRRDMSFGDILQLGRGSLVELNKLADEPVDIYVNQSKIAEGEVVVVDEHFGVRITKLLNAERHKKLG
ncbi:MAG: flagellar motor switch protein FliN [bacterium]